jgi:hypothetical protein
MSSQYRIGYFRAIWMSFYSADVYREVARTWRGVGILYLLLVLAITWLPTPVRWARALQNFAESYGQKVVDQLPAIKIQDGVMSSSPSGRHVILDPQDERGERALVIIDDSIDEAPSEMPTDTIVLTRLEAGMIRPSRSERRVWKLSGASNVELTPTDIQGLIQSWPFWIPPLCYVFAVAGSLAFRSLQLLVYTAVGQALARRAKVKLDGRALFRLSAVAVTPVIVLRTLLWFGPWEPAWYIRWPIAIAITLAYLRFGIRAAGAEASPVGSAS